MTHCAWETWRLNTLKFSDHKEKLMRGSIADENYDKRENKEKHFFRLVTSVGQRKYSESPQIPRSDALPYY